MANHKIRNSNKFVIKKTLTNQKLMPVWRHGPAVIKKSFMLNSVTEPNLVPVGRGYLLYCIL